jgi:hypothetical protein
MPGDMPSPGAEFRIAAAGPAVSPVLEVRTRVASAATERRRPQPTAAARPLSSSRWAR